MFKMSYGATNLATYTELSEKFNNILFHFGKACTDDLKIIKTMGDKLKFITDITSDYKCECNQLCLKSK